MVYKQGSHYREVVKGDWFKTVVLLFGFVSLMAAGAILLMPVYWYLWLALVALMVFLLVRWHNRNFAYRCPKCEQEFEISIMVDLISPHGIGKGGGWKYLRCPACRKWSACKVIKKE